MSDKRPPPRPEGLPRISPGGDQPERDAVRMPRAEPPARTRTMPGIPTVPLAPPPLPPELAPTKPAPPNPLRHETWRIPTPPSALARAARSDPPPPVDPPAPKPASPRQPEAPTWPPAVTPARPSPVPTSSQSPEAKLERTVGQLVMLVGKRFGWPALAAALGLAGVLKPSTDPRKTDQTLASVEEIARKVDRLDAKVNGLLEREPADAEFVDCLYSQQKEYFEQLLPSQERLVTGELRRTWVDRCRNRKPKR